MRHQSLVSLKIRKWRVASKPQRPTQKHGPSEDSTSNQGLSTCDSEKPKGYSDANGTSAASVALPQKARKACMHTPTRILAENVSSCCKGADSTQLTVPCSRQETERARLLAPHVSASMAAWNAGRRVSTTPAASLMSSYKLCRSFLKLFVK